MHSHKKASFSINLKYFACVSNDDNLLIWETLNNTFIDCKFDSSIYTACSSLYWIPIRDKPPSPKKAKLNKNQPSENQLLAVGTNKGDILLYNVSCKNLYLHLVGRHSGAINDMCFHSETDLFVTCSNDKSIALWDIVTGKQKLKWKTGDEPVSSICIIDGNNILSSSSSVMWWNISEKNVIKKFSGHSTEIFKLLPVNAVSLNSCYFLSAAVSDVKINAWSLNSSECKTPVASFVLSEQLNDLDISKTYSKDKPLILSAVTKDGFFHLFEHVLNGNVNQPVLPQVSLKIISESCSPSVMCLKISPDSESCIIAYGSSKDNMTFKHINVKELLIKSQEKSSGVSETSKTDRSVPINGLKSSSKCSENIQKKTQLDSVVTSYRRKLRSSSLSLSSDNAEALNLSAAKESKNIRRNRNHVEVNLEDPKCSADLLMKGLLTQNEDIIDAVLCISDTELIKKCVEHLSSSSMKLVLDELNNRLCRHPCYTPTLSKWLKQISEVHLKNIVQSEEIREVFHSIKQYISSLNIHKTIYKMSALKGLLSFTSQISSSDENSSDCEELKDL